MVDQVGFDREAVANELEGARRDFHALLQAASSDDLCRRSAGTKWTNEQLLFHMLFGYIIVLALLWLVRLFSRLPRGLSRGFARLLASAVVPFNAVNYWGWCAGAVLFNHRRMGAKLDRVIAALQRRLAAATDNELERGMCYPTNWDPFFRSYMTLAELYRYPTQHYGFHRRQLTLGLPPRD